MYAAIAAPLTDKTKNSEPNKIAWEASQQLAFDALKQTLITVPILHLPNLDIPFILRTDASDLGIGAILLQELQRECNYSTIEKECLALVWGVQKYQAYLYGKAFNIETEHQPLAYMQKAKVANARIMRWALTVTLPVSHNSNQRIRQCWS